MGFSIMGAITPIHAFPVFLVIIRQTCHFLSDWLLLQTKNVKSLPFSPFLICPENGK